MIICYLLQVWRITEFYLLQFVLFVFDFEQDVCKTTIFYAEQMCKRVVNAQGGNISHSNDKEGFGSSLNDGIYVRGRRRGNYKSVQFSVQRRMLPAI